MSNEQINKAIVTFESALFAGQPEWNSKEEYIIYENWLNERKPFANEFKAALVAGNVERAKHIANTAMKKFNFSIKG